jgi:hypothetical protein
MLVLFACVAAAGLNARAADGTGLLGGSVKLEYLYTDGAEITEYATLPKEDIGAHVEFADSRLHFANGGKPWRFCITMDITDTNIRISDLYLLWNVDDKTVLSLDVNAPAKKVKAAAVSQEQGGPVEKEPVPANR